MRTLQELAREALQVQDACNLSGVAQSFARAMTDLCKHVEDTSKRNCHPVALLWADKIAHLTSIQSFSTANHLQDAYRWCHEQTELKEAV